MNSANTPPQANVGMMLVISAPSGTGKSTLIRRLTAEFSAFTFSVSCTTRAPRPGEADGREYHFLTREEFERRRDESYFAEWAEVHGNLYGTPRQTTMDLLTNGRDVIFDIDVQGARQIKSNMGQGCYVFVFPPSRAALEARLTGRGTDSEATIIRRLAAARDEIRDSRWFDHWIVNDDLRVAYEQLRAVYVAEKTRPAYQESWQAALIRQWGALMKTPPALVVALDFPETAQALSLASSLQGIVPWVKVGLELYLNSGQELIARLKDMGFKVFLDLKFMDIPNTVQAATAQATRMGADMLTIHALGGRAMCEAAAAGRAQALAPGQTSPLILAVTLLTSLGPKDLAWNPDATEASLRDLTVHLAQGAQNWKLDGVVCSGREVRVIRQACGASFQLLTPGIRLPDADSGDQSRVCTPAQAASDGSDYLVVGRPITRSDNPVQAARNYLKTIT